MSDMSTHEFADAVGIELAKLQDIMKSAEIHLSASGTVSREDKSRLLMYLRNRRGSDEPEEPTSVVLSRRSFAELKGVTNAQGGNRQRIRSQPISVEIRKTRVYAKRGHLQREEDEHAITEQGFVQEQVLPSETTTESDQQLAAPQVETDIDNVAGAAVVAAESEHPVAVEDSTLTEATVPADIDSGSIAAEVEAEIEGDTQLAAVGADISDPEQQLAAEVMLAETAEALPADAAGKKETGTRDDGGRKRKKQESELHIADDMSGRRRKKKRLRVVSPADERQHSFRKPSTPVVREVMIPDHITVQDLAQRMAIKSGDLIKFLMNLGTMVTINQSIDQQTAVAVVEEMGHKASLVKADELESEVIAQHEDSAAETVPRAPVVAVMGHVDHGKTTLLDKIRNSNVAAAEAGGITQHIGAYVVKTAAGQQLTFLDTPGHEAFTTMRARGAGVTDIAVIVVAADSGVQPQTIEAVQHARAAAVPMVVAVSKCDKSDSDPARIRQQMSDAGVTPEEWGGDTLFVDVSAASGTGIDTLLESILLQAEILELQAPVGGTASGIVLEAYMDKSLGAVATVLVQKGTLHKGDFLLCGIEYGRIRQLRDENGRNVTSAVPSYPVAVTGLSSTPTVGEVAMVVANERKARELALQRRRGAREKELASRSQLDVGQAMSQLAPDASQTNQLTVILKADVQGTAEALRNALEGCSTESVKVEIISAGVGSITASDVNLAMAGNAFLAGFNVRADSQARKLLREENIEPHYYNVIYDLIDDVKRMASDLVEPEVREHIVGLAEVRQVFRASKVGEVAGCMVTEGFVRRGLPIRVLSDNVVVFEGELESLRHFKEDVQEVKAGSECGIGVKNYHNIRVGDQIEVFERRLEKVTQ